MWAADNAVHLHLHFLQQGPGIANMFIDSGFEVNIAEQAGTFAHCTLDKQRGAVSGSPGDGKPDIAFRDDIQGN